MMRVFTVIFAFGKHKLTKNCLYNQKLDADISMKGYLRGLTFKKSCKYYFLWSNFNLTLLQIRWINPETKSLETKYDSNILCFLNALSFVRLLDAKWLMIYPTKDMREVMLNVVLSLLRRRHLPEAVFWSPSFFVDG